jgi:hypothetical protein
VLGLASLTVTSSLLVDYQGRAREVEPSLPSQPLPQRSVEPRQQSRPRWRFCTGRGHDKSQCRKRQGLEMRQVGQTKCETCATPGFTQSDCPNCFLSSLHTHHSSQSFQMQSHPIVKVTTHVSGHWSIAKYCKSRNVPMLRGTKCS